MSFTNTSRGIAEEFLQTVLFVDDRAFENLSQDPQTTTGTELTVPGRKGKEQLPEPSGENVEEEYPKTEAEPDAGMDYAHELDSEKLIKEFSERQMFCSVFSPEEEKIDAFRERIPKVASRADILVIDWVLVPGGSGEGAETLDIIRRIIEIDENGIGVGKGRLRLIAIYTGTPDLSDIVETLKEGLEEEQAAQVCVVDEFTLRVGNARISVYAKEGSRISVEQESLYERKKELADLPNLLVDEFSQMTTGLVSNTAVRSMTALRESTFRLLSTFHKDLDAPYLEHRVLLENPEDAQAHLVDVIAKEINTILIGSDVGREVKLDVLREWVADRIEDPRYGLHQLFEGAEPSVDPVLKLLAQSVYLDDGEYPTELQSLGNKPHKKNIAKYFSRSGYDAEDLSMEFAALMTLKSKYGDDKPVLSLGTVLKSSREGEDGKNRSEYLLCVQPRCDSVRIRSERSFPLIPIRVVTGNETRHFVARDGDDFLKMKIVYRPHLIKMVSFEPSGGGSVVRASNAEGGAYYFEATNGKRYDWVSELKFEHAQRVAENFANKLSRVGLDESEWLRRLGP